MSNEMEQAALDRLSLTLADLDFDSRLATVVNGFVYAKSSPLHIVSAMAKCMITLSAVIDDDELKRNVARLLREMATTFEAAIENTSRRDHLH